MGQVWRKCDNTHNFLLYFNKWSKYFSVVLHHTSTQYVKYGKIKELYNFSNDSLFRYFRALVIMPKLNQKCYVKWANKLSELFTVANGVKQGAVISPLLFSIYIDNLFSKIKQLVLGCHVAPTFAGAFGCADDVALIASSLYALKKMISVCESYAERYHITFNPKV